MLLVLMPLLFRYSRSVWLHIFIRYDASFLKKQKSQVTAEEKLEEE